MKTIPSDAKILMNDWDTLSRIIRQIAIPAHKREDDSSELLADSVINDALAGPYRPFLACKLKAFANLCALRMLITSAENDTLQEEKKDLAKSAHPLAKYVGKTTIGEIDKRQKQLDEITNEHFSQWQEQIKAWITAANSALIKNDIPLSALESQELAELLPFFELKKRFVDLQIEFPDLKEMNFSHYFKLKIQLVLRNSLARRQLLHTQKEIDLAIKQLKNLFNDIHQTETTLIKQQEAPTLKIADFN